MLFFPGKFWVRLSLATSMGVMFTALAWADGPSALSGTKPSGWDLIEILDSLPGRVLTTTELDRLHSLVRPQSGESRWSEIPWMTSLWEARKKAAAEGKPLFVWVISDGHPCGIC